MTAPGETRNTEDKAIVYSFSLSEQEIKNRQAKRIVARIGAGILLIGLLYGSYRIWNASIQPVNKFGILALVAFLALYLSRFAFSPSSESAGVEKRLVISERGIAVNNNFVEWAQIDQAELKNKREDKYLELRVNYKREGYTSPAQSYMFIWQIDRYGDREQIIADINRHLQSPVRL
jgi:hypothetical protein